MRLCAFYLVLFSLYCVVITEEVNETNWMTMNEILIAIPIQEYCKDQYCLTKCCPEDQMMKEDGVCEKLNNTAYKGTETLSEEIKNLINEKPIQWIRNSKLTESDIIISVEYIAGVKNLTLAEDGQVHQWFEYCLDMAEKNGTQKLWFKILEIESPYIYAMTLFKVIGRVTSCFFMLLVLLVYCLLPSLRNMGGLLLMAQLLSLMMSYLIIFIQDLYTSEWIFNLGEYFCFRSSAAYYFFTMSSFFWLNIMSYDIWCIMKSYTHVSNGFHTEKPRVNKFKLRLYMLYAWGVPALITAVIVILALNEVDDHVIHPFTICLANPNELMLTLPIGIMTGINLILFSMTAFNIRNTKKDVSKNSYSRNTKKNKSRFILNIKLFVIMGLSWILELVNVTMDTPALYVPVNFCNVFIGVFIFFIYICNKNVYRKLIKRFHIKTSSTNNNRSTKYSKTEITDLSGPRNRNHETIRI